MANFIDYNEKVLQVKNLKKYFRVGAGRRKLMIPAVDGVTFDVFKREVFGVVGESGSGKTTLGRTIIKLYQPTDGSVVLNNVKISAGSMGFQEEIKAIKIKLKNDITSLNPAKVKAIELQQQTNQEIELLKKDLQQLAKDKATELVVINKQFDQYRADQYQLKALMQIELNAMVFEFNQKVMAAKRLMQNDALLKYNNEVKIEKTKLQNKLNGLKDSAALDEKTIKQRMDKLIQASNEYLAKLKATYDPQIEDAKKNVISKAQVNTLISGYLKEKNQKVSSIKAEFNAKMAKLVAPNKDTFVADKQKLDKKYQKLESGIQKQILKIKSDLKITLGKLPKQDQAFLQDAKIKAKIAQLKLEANGKIKELKVQLEQARRVNNSNDTLKESQKMQMIFQDPISSLNPRMTVREIIGEGLIIEKKLTKKEIDKKVEEALVLVGLSPEYASRYPHEFSGGQRQRIGVARALIMNPNVIIADEPISALDVSIRAQIINLLFNLREKLGLTVLFIAHDLSVVRFFCDRIAVMFNGKVVELASSEELFKNPMHPYTISLLSAIPQPDPDYEKNRKRIHYNPRQHDYRTDLPTLKEIGPQHFVYANNAEFSSMQAQYKGASKENK
jgi:oligopeptide transport system ATP-binding protein